MNALSPREAYKLWAPRYGEETAITTLDEKLISALSPSTAGMRLLDAGCGTGRRLPRDAALATGVDLSPEMLAAGGASMVAAADVRALPFEDKCFDLIWCRLVLGHIADPTPAYRELARVCRTGGNLVITDFHADAANAGHRRSLRDLKGHVHDIEHHIHDDITHVVMARSSGWMLVAQQDAHIGPSVERFYTAAGRDTAYAKDTGLAVVAAFLFRRI
ncbi:MAG TPA: methyltransferase domain-containing protein [Rhizomicrobium sp.]|jgi:malonyl-CoA O-methyltransferase